MPCGFAYRADFRRFLCELHRSWWGGAVIVAAFPPPPATPTPPTLISICTTHLSRQWADLPTDCGQFSPHAVR
jgi:hypothetical protein